MNKLVDSTQLNVSQREEISLTKVMNSLMPLKLMKNILMLSSIPSTPSLKMLKVLMIIVVSVFQVSIILNYSKSQNNVPLILKWSIPILKIPLPHSEPLILLVESKKSDKSGAKVKLPLMNVKTISNK